MRTARLALATTPLEPESSAAELRPREKRASGFAPESRAWKALSLLLTYARVMRHVGVAPTCTLAGNPGYSRRSLSSCLLTREAGDRSCTDDSDVGNVVLCY